MKFSPLGIAAAVLALAPMFANALPAGQYDVGGRQQICLVGDGTWFGTTFSGWAGAYQNVGAKTFIFGNFLQGAGNDSMTFAANHRGQWVEWSDDLIEQSVLHNVTISFVKDVCDSAPQLRQELRGTPMGQ